MHGMRCTNMEYFLYRLRSCYQFRALRWLILIGKLSLKPHEANGTTIWPWIVLKLNFQYWSFLEKIQVCIWLFCAALWLSALGLGLPLYIERIWSIIQAHSLAFNDFQDLIFKNLFQYLFMHIWYKTWPITLIPSISDHARNLELIPCIKRFKKFGLIFSTYFN